MPVRIVLKVYNIYMSIVALQLQNNYYITLYMRLENRAKNTCEILYKI